MQNSNTGPYVSNAEAQTSEVETPRLLRALDDFSYQLDINAKYIQEIITSLDKFDSSQKEESPVKSPSPIINGALSFLETQITRFREQSNYIAAISNSLKKIIG